jgi:hypothetical protein
MGQLGMGGGLAGSMGGLGGKPLGGLGSPQSPYATGAMAAGMGGGPNYANSGNPTMGNNTQAQPFNQNMGKIGMNDGGFVSSQNNMIPGDGFNNTSSSMQNLGLAAFKYGGWVK